MLYQKKDPTKIHWKYSDKGKLSRQKIWLKAQYGLSLDDYSELLTKQNNKCAICATSESDHQSGRFLVDHNHDTGEVRGILCNSCNSGIGFFNDDKEKLSNAIKYLDRDISFIQEFINNQKKKLLPEEKFPEDRSLKNRYGIVKITFNKILEAQNNSCGICYTKTPGGKGNSFHVDHCHISDKIRGLLCVRCNLGLGALKDSKDVVSKAMNYLGDDSD